MREHQGEVKRFICSIIGVVACSWQQKAAANAALNAVLLQIAKRAMGCCDQMLQVCTHKTVVLGSKGYLSSK